MAGNAYLLDTVIVAGYFNRDQAIHGRLLEATVYISSITVGELYYGAYNSGKVTSNLQNIRRFVELVTVLVCDAATADHYGQVKRALRVLGKPIPENDIWIAATALQHSLTLVTRDDHFNTVAGLLLERW
ncbi:MAG: type II toxin-antitoxin system VapC family toxin [Anaerolineae bacterium]|nr:type II toxin-antitoxin system VapC family toxin [Anaerolineae bacterium]